jgi:hypothetical protein
MSAPRKLAAILAADVAGYSRLMGGARSMPSIRPRSNAPSRHLRAPKADSSAQVNH